MSPRSIPEPRLQAVKNETPFPHFDCDKMGVGRRYYDTVVVKGTFVLAQGSLALAEEQAQITLVDELWDPANAERSSLKHAGEVVLTKPSTDVIVTGVAHAPGRPSHLSRQSAGNPGATWPGTEYGEPSV